MLRLSQLLPSQAIGPCTRWAASVIGCRAILAPSKAQPPAAAPGVSDLAEQPVLRSLSVFARLVAQPGSSKRWPPSARTSRVPRSPDPSRGGDAGARRRRPRAFPGRYRVSSKLMSVCRPRRSRDPARRRSCRGSGRAPAGPLVAEGREAVVVVPVEDRERQPDQRDPAVALQVLAVAAADQEVGRLGRQQRTHVPQVLARPDLAAGAERRGLEQLLHLLRPQLAAVGGEHVQRLGTQLHQEADDAHAEVRDRRRR